MRDIPRGFFPCLLSHPLKCLAYIISVCLQHSLLEQQSWKDLQIYRALIFTPHMKILRTTQVTYSGEHSLCISESRLKSVFLNTIWSSKNYLIYQTIISYRNIFNEKHHLQLCCCLVTKLRSTLYHPMDYSTSGFPILQCLPEFTQIHVHWVSDFI